MKISFSNISSMSFVENNVICIPIREWETDDGASMIGFFLSILYESHFNVFAEKLIIVDHIIIEYADIRDEKCYIYKEDYVLLLENPICTIRSWRWEKYSIEYHRAMVDIHGVRDMLAIMSVLSDKFTTERLEATCKLE